MFKLPVDIITEEENTMKTAKNTILYGPPGTGKTYNTAYYAVAIIEERPVGEVVKESYAEVSKRFSEYKKAGLIEFTTFHLKAGYRNQGYLS